MKIREWSCDPPSGRPSRYRVEIDREGFQSFLSRAIEVEPAAWGSYSHVAMCDAVGSLCLEDGRTGRWLLRPGGLGQIEWSDGTMTYLVDGRAISK